MLLSSHSYVFDGKPPEMKSGELLKRSEKRAEAEKDLAKAVEQGKCCYMIDCWQLGASDNDEEFFTCTGDQEKMEKFEKRLV